MSQPDTSEADGSLPLGFRQIPAARFGVQVVHDLVAAIVTGAVAEGQSLPPEAELAAQFGVSRTVIRESVKRLEEKGLVIVSQGRGTAVAGREQWNILDRVVISTMIENDSTLGILDELAVVRSELESSMAGRAASRRTREQLDDLRAALDAMSSAVHDPERFSETDQAFHALVMQISGNDLARSIARTLLHRASENARFHGAPGADAIPLTLEEHRAVLESITEADASASSEAMRTHITKAWERRRLPRQG